MHQRVSGAKPERFERSELAFSHQHQVLGQKRAVDDESVVALNIARIFLVIMDAVTVHGEGGIAEQFRGGEAVRLALHLVGSRGWRRWLGRGKINVLTIHEVLVFGHAQGAALMDVVAQGDKGKRASAAELLGDGFDCRDFGGGGARDKGGVKLQRATRPHAARQTKFGDKIANGWMPVPPEIVWRLRIPEIDLVSEWQQVVTGFWRWASKTQCCVQGACAGRVECAGSGL